VVVQVSDRVEQVLGLRAGDVIVQINRTPVADAPQAARLIESAGGGGPVRMFVERAGMIYSTDFRIR
jgi:membrane-associated protease RseP (regulator of RpoE activity)